MCSWTALSSAMILIFFFFNDTATTEIYTLSLHDALPILGEEQAGGGAGEQQRQRPRERRPRSEEHTSELQSRLHLVCRLLLEKKKNLLHDHVATPNTRWSYPSSTSRRAGHCPPSPYVARP